MYVFAKKTSFMPDRILNLSKDPLITLKVVNIIKFTN